VLLFPQSFLYMQHTGRFKTSVTLYQESLLCNTDIYITTALRIGLLDLVDKCTMIFRNVGKYSLILLTYITHIYLQAWLPFWDCLNLKKKKLHHTFETSVNIYLSIRHNIPEDSNLQQCEGFKCFMFSCNINL
jgi:hypothetical protein